eukprot:10983976-Prorocentrum_lima.AAC.1
MSGRVSIGVPGANPPTQIGSVRDSPSSKWKHTKPCSTKKPRWSNQRGKYRMENTCLLYTSPSPRDSTSS